MKARMPDGILNALLVATLVLTAVTAASNIGHGYNLALYAGQSERLATLAAVVPDVLIAVAATVLGFRHRNPWAWAALASAIGFVGWAAVVTSLPGFCTPDAECKAIAADAVTRVLVAVWPLLAAVLVAGVMASLLHDRVPAVVAKAVASTPRKASPATPPKEVAPKAIPDAPPAVSPQVTGGGTVAARIVAVLEEGAKTRADLVALTGAADGTVKKELTKLKDSGAIEQDPTKAHHWRTHTILRAVAR